MKKVLFPITITMICFFIKTFAEECESCPVVEMGGFNKPVSISPCKTNDNFLHPIVCAPGSTIKDYEDACNFLTDSKKIFYFLELARSGKFNCLVIPLNWQVCCPSNLHWKNFKKGYEDGMNTPIELPAQPFDKIVRDAALSAKCRLFIEGKEVDKPTEPDCCSTLIMQGFNKPVMISPCRESDNHLKSVICSPEATIKNYGDACNFLATVKQPFYINLAQAEEFNCLALPLNWFVQCSTNLDWKNFKSDYISGMKDPANLGNPLFDKIIKKAALRNNCTLCIDDKVITEKPY